jgi:hypothetical protein
MRSDAFGSNNANEDYQEHTDVRRFSCDLALADRIPGPHCGDCGRPLIPEAGAFDGGGRARCPGCKNQHRADELARRAHFHASPPS